MISLEQIRQYYPAIISDNSLNQKYILKEYIQLMVLDFLSNTVYVKQIRFIGGTYLRLVHGIDRFSEDIDFDCKNMSETEFYKMTDEVILFLKRSGFNIEEREKTSKKLVAFRRNIYFPSLLFDLKLTGHREERFLLKIETQDQQIEYPVQFKNITGCGFFFAFPAPTDEVLCAMKISAMLSRQKGRDFYDVLFLLGFTQPDYTFLSAKCGIDTVISLKKAIDEMLDKTNIKNKARDFEHLLFNKQHAARILQFKTISQELLK